MATAFILFTLKWQFSKDLELQNEFWLHSFIIDQVEKREGKKWRKHLKTAICLKCLSLIFHLQNVSSRYKAQIGCKVRNKKCIKVILSIAIALIYMFFAFETYLNLCSV